MPMEITPNSLPVIIINLINIEAHLDFMIGIVRHIDGTWEGNCRLIMSDGSSQWTLIKPTNKNESIQAGINDAKAIVEGMRVHAETKSPNNSRIYITEFPMDADINQCIDIFLKSDHFWSGKGKTADEAFADKESKKIIAEQFLRKIH